MPELNRQVRWHILENWGRFLRQSPRGSRRRKVLADIIRHVRRTGEVTADHYRAVVFADALVREVG